MRSTVPATTTVAAWISRRRSPRGRRGWTSGSGAGRARQPRRPGAVARGRRVGFKCFLLDSGVTEFPHLPRRVCHCDGGDGAAGGADDRHAEDGSLLDDSRWTASKRGFLASRPVPPRGRDRAGPRAGAGEGGVRTSCTVGRGRRPDAALRPRRGGGRVGRDLPHYYLAPRRADGATELKCCRRSARRQPRGALAALAAGDVDLVVSDHSPARSLKASPTSAWLGGISSCSSASGRVDGARARGHSLVDVVRWMARRPQTRRTRDRGRIASAPGRPRPVRPRRAFTVDVARLSTAKPCRRTPAAARGRGTGDWLRGYGRRRCARDSCL